MKLILVRAGLLGPALLMLAGLAGCQTADRQSGVTTPTDSTPVPVATAPVQAGGGIVGDPAQVIEDYLTARVAADTNAMINLSCAGWESDARKESNSLRGVKARLEGMACTVDSLDPQTALVLCAGNIVANYNGEDRPLPLDKRKFKLIAEGGEWRMCGYE
ncbi:MAG: hypothetical protein RMN25_01340 [Anaerolineae bacterium]|nr:hypothetical protein [Thermoflexales bacterium]MDW8406399.1 hypothetical protein [Anaerolineae bacterium]